MTVSVCPVCTVPETLAMVGVVAKAMDGKPRTTIARSKSAVIMIERRLKRSATTPDNGPMTTLGKNRATMIRATARLEPVSLRAMV